MRSFGPKDTKAFSFTNKEVPIIIDGCYKEGWDRGNLPDPFETDENPV